MPPPVPEIFRSDCIRAPARPALDAKACEQIGLSLGSEARARGFTRLVVARDGRLPSQDCAGMLMAGLNDAGVHVLDLGLAPIGVMQAAAHAEAQGCGVMVGGGRSPAPWNGFKPMLGGVPLAGDDLQALRRRIEAQDFASGSGDFDREGREAAYVDAVQGAVALARPLKLVLDHGNGATATVGAELFKRLGCTVHEIWPQVDGNFPNHFPDPSAAESFVDAISVQRSSQQGEIAFVFSSDGAGVAAVDTRGYAIDPDRLLMLLAADVLAAQPGAAIVADVRCSARVAAFVAARGGRFVTAPVGHGHVEAVMKREGALLAGDATGHFFFADRWHGHDDALYAAARIAEVLSKSADAAAGAAVLAALPKAHVPAEVRLKAEAEVALPLLEALAAQEIGGVMPTRLETDGRFSGLRVDWPDAMCVARVATTQAALAVRFEGTDAAALQRSQSAFKAAFARVRPGTPLPF